jgi:hypothetical protein
MRKIGVLLGSFALGLVVVSIVAGQQETQKKKFGGGFGGGFGFGGGGFQASPINLIQNEQVKKELDITEEQLEKVPAAIEKALAEVLNPKQVSRLHQIELQLRGSRAFTDAKVQKDLKMTDEQVTSVKSILEDSAKEAGEIRKEAQGDFQGTFQKIAALNKETAEKVQGVLTADQRKQWKQMTGEEFKLEQKGFGGGGFKKKNKKDAEE